MNYKKLESLVRGVSGIFFLALFLACPSSVWAGQKELAASIAETRSELLNTKDLLKSTSDALNNLQENQGDDLKTTYDIFVVELEKVKVKELAIKERAVLMQANAAGHFESWQKDVDALNSAALRAASGKRLIRVKKSYESAVEQMKVSGSLFKPYVADLSDIAKALSNDLTVGGVKSIGSVIRQARSSLNTVSAAIDDAMAQMDIVEQTLSSN